MRNGWKNVSNESLRESQNSHFKRNNFSENSAVYGIITQNAAETDMTLVP
jgi:hypothetical protein